MIPMNVSGRLLCAAFAVLIIATNAACGGEEKRAPQFVEPSTSPTPALARESLGSAGARSSPATDPADPTGLPEPTGPADPTVTTESTATPGGGVKVISWIRNLGPLGGGEGAHEAAFGAVVYDQCTHPVVVGEGFVEPYVTLYRGALAACLAALHGKRDRWATAERSLATIDAKRPKLDCLDEAACGLLRDLVRLHRQFPSAKMRKVAGGPGQGPFCPRVRHLSPDHGPSAGGTVVTLTGENFPPRAVIHLGDYYQRTVSTTGGSKAVVTTPPRSVTRQDGLLVWIEGWPLINDTEQFLYDDVPPEPGVSASG
jgi:hypothetical protein